MEIKENYQLQDLIYKYLLKKFDWLCIRNLHKKLKEKYLKKLNFKNKVQLNQII